MSSKTVYGLIKEAKQNLKKYTVDTLDEAYEIMDIVDNLDRALDAIDNGGSLETVVRI
jgi:molecular chaperone GrpE (heat shock protein)